MSFLRIESSSGVLHCMVNIIRSLTLLIKVFKKFSTINKIYLIFAVGENLSLRGYI